MIDNNLPTHVQYLDGGIRTIRPYTVPERTWIALQDAMAQGSWSEDWFIPMKPSVKHPHIPTITDLNAQLTSTSTSEATLRELVLLVAALTMAVDAEASFINRIEDIVLNDYQPFRPTYTDCNYNDEDEDDQDEDENTRIVFVPAPQKPVPGRIMTWQDLMLIAMLLGTILILFHMQL